MQGVFADFADKAYPFKFTGQLVLDAIAGGIPSDPKVAEGWLRSKLTDNKDDDIKAMIATVMDDRGVSVEEATRYVDTMKHLNGFKRGRCETCATDGPLCASGNHPLYIEGRQLKAALKEACSVAMAAGKLPSRGWGKTNKGLLSYLAEHVFVCEDRLYLGKFNPEAQGQPVTEFHTEPTGVNQRFVHVFRGSGIQYEEYVEKATIDFNVISDHDFDGDDWAYIWTAGEQNGLGASRSQGYGRYNVTRWDRVK